MVSNSSEEYHDVIVIGAGWSGILCTKYMLEESLNVVTLEKRDNLGGTWYFSEDENVNSVMKSTYATSSVSVTEMSDFPMPQDKGYFLHHSDMLQYLHSYADHFKLTPRIHFNTSVSSVAKENELWYVSAERSGKAVVYVSKHLVVASGLVDIRNTKPKHDVFKDFTGKIYHAGELKEHKPEHEGCKLLIYGGGETSSDILTDWHNHTERTYWSIPRGQHFFRKYTKILPWRKPQVLDKVSSRLVTAIAPYHHSKPGLAWVCNWTTSGSLTAYQGHGIPEWKNNAAFMHSFVNKNGSVLDLVDYKRVFPKAEVKTCHGKKVKFSDGEEVDIDVIILSTGYTCDHSYLKDDSKKSFENRYKYIFDNDDPSIAFVGYVRPVVGSVPALAEVQARWVAKVFRGTQPLPPFEQRVIQTEKDNAFWKHYFKHSTSRLIGQLVEGYIYIDSMAKEAGIYPNYYKLFCTNLHHWYISMVSPFSGCIYRLNEPAYQKTAIARLQEHREHTITPVHLLLILFCRLIWFDWFLRQLEKVKYRCQTSSVMKKLSTTPPVSFVNSVWCIPKRILFETSKQ